MPSQHTYCGRVWNLIQDCDVQSSDSKVYISTPPSAVVLWHQLVYTFFIPCGHLVIQSGHDSILQVFIICQVFTSKVLHFGKQEKVRRCQIWTVRRMFEDIPMEFFTQQGLCLPGSMRTCIVVQQNNSTRELASSAR